jgi:hypothetical protein
MSTLDSFSKKENDPHNITNLPHLSKVLSGISWHFLSNNLFYKNIMFILYLVQHLQKGLNANAQLFGIGFGIIAFQM